MRCGFVERKTFCVLLVAILGTSSTTFAISDGGDSKAASSSLSVGKNALIGFVRPKAAFLSFAADVAAEEDDHVARITPEILLVVNSESSAHGRILVAAARQMAKAHQTAFDQEMIPIQSFLEEIALIFSGSDFGTSTLVVAYKPVSFTVLTGGQKTCSIYSIDSSGEVNSLGCQTVLNAENLDDMVESLELAELAKNDDICFTRRELLIRLRSRLKAPDHPRLLLSSSLSGEEGDFEVDRELV